MMKTRYILAFLLPLMLSVAMSAKDTAMPFLSISPDPVSMAMGGTSAKGAFSHFGSLADTGLGDGTMAAGVAYGSFQPGLANSDIVSAGVVYRIDRRFDLTLGFLGNFGEKYEVSDEYGVSIGQFRPSDYRVGAGLSWRIIDKLSAGISLNYAQTSPSPSIGGDKKVLRTGFADIQVRYQPLEWLGVSLAGKNLGVPVDSYSLPYYAQAGVDGAWNFGKHSLDASVEAGMYFSPSAFNAGAGVQYGYADHYFVRAGGHYCGKEAGIPSFFSAGAGLLFAGFSLDFSWNYASGPMKNTVNVGIGYRF
ncbi:MAG: PorV/PorQ family protein [Candidatus Cryptobacteroides sp.]